MEPSDAIAAMAALAQPTRLAIMRHLLRNGAAPLSSGEIAERVEVTPPTASGHLAILSRAGLVEQIKSGRWVLCRAVPHRISALRGFLEDLSE